MRLFHIDEKAGNEFSNLKPALYKWSDSDFWKFLEEKNIDKIKELKKLVNSLDFKDAMYASITRIEEFIGDVNFEITKVLEKNKQRTWHVVIKNESKRNT